MVQTITPKDNSLKMLLTDINILFCTQYQT